MNESEVNKDLEALLGVAMEMLDDVKGKFALFERQHYGKLKRKFEQLKSLNKNVRLSLYKVRCSGESRKSEYS